MKSILKKQKPVAQAEQEAVEVQRIFLYSAIPTFTGGGFKEGFAMDINVQIMTDKRYCAFRALGGMPAKVPAAYAVFNTKEEAEEKLNIRIGRGTLVKPQQHI